jgi:hypothetical protein
MLFCLSSRDVDLFFRRAVVGGPWAFCGLTKSAWARQFYDAKIAKGKSHHNALRALGNRWLELLWHCITHSTTYNESTHLRNRQHALHTQPAA